MSATNIDVGIEE